MPSGTIVFSHANGFPAGTYEVLFQAWQAAGYTVKAVERYGHDPRYGVTGGWRGLRDQLIAFIEGETPGSAYLVGHSMGGLLSLMAACKRPDLVSGLVLLDSPVVTGWRARGLQLLKQTGLLQRVSPGKVSLQRRCFWPDRESVYTHFKAKPAFAKWDERVLRNYVTAGFDDAGGGIELGFRREVETQIYNTLPHHLGPLLEKSPPQCRVGFIAGSHSTELRLGGFAGARALSHGRFVWLDGSHLYPMERPDATARAVLDLLVGMD